MKKRQKLIQFKYLKNSDSNSHFSYLRQIVSPRHHLLTAHAWNWQTWKLLALWPLHTLNLAYAATLSKPRCNQSWWNGTLEKSLYTAKHFLLPRQAFCLLTHVFLHPSLLFFFLFLQLFNIGVQLGLCLCILLSCFRSQLEPLYIRLR